jgi:hypothetical protein
MWAKDVGSQEMRRVAYDKLGNGIEVSTVWLGLDQNFCPGGRPLIFETMLFVPQTKIWVDPWGHVWHNSRESIGDQWRYSTEEEALLGHKMQVKKWKNFQSIDKIMNEATK